MKLKRFQTDAVQRMRDASLVFLDQEDGRHRLLVLKAPTGGGKTVMLAEYLRRLAPEDLDLTFLWASPGKGQLHLQSLAKVEEVLGGALNCVLLEPETLPDVLPRNTVHFVSWDALSTKDKDGNWTNRLMRDGERRNLRQAIEDTRRAGRTVVLVVDESHVGAKGSQLKTTQSRIAELRAEVIKAPLTVEASATPVFPPEKDVEAGLAEVIRIPMSVVVDAQMVKREVLVNHGGDAASGSDSEGWLFEQAVAKRDDLAEAYAAEGTGINPLCIVQVDNAKGEDRSDREARVIELLAKAGKTVENGKVAIWKSEEKANTEGIAEPGSPVEFLVFKQAVDTGWDCPRAHVLLQYREPTVETFSIQTVGRILRMPERKYYKDHDVLNVAYVYTVASSVKVDASDGDKPPIKTQVAHLRTDLVPEPPVLPSEYVVRPGKRPAAKTIDYTIAFRDALRQVLGDYEDLAQALADNGYDINPRDLTAYLGRGRIGTSTLAGGGEVPEGERLEFAKTARQAQNEMRADLIRLCGAFTDSYAASFVVQQSLYRLYQDATGDGDNLASFWVANREALSGLVERSVAIYKENVETKSSRYVEPATFRIARDFGFPEDAPRHESAKYAMVPALADKKPSGPERKFEQFLDGCGEVAWFWKNGESEGLDGEGERKYFSLAYRGDDDRLHNFFPDYLVGLKGGGVAVLEVKGGYVAEGTYEESSSVGDIDWRTTPFKAKALADWKHAHRNDDSFPVTHVGICQPHSNGTWFVHDGEGKYCHLAETGFGIADASKAGWRPLADVLRTD